MKKSIYSLIAKNKRVKAAVIFGEQTLSYTELHRQISYFSSYLLEQKLVAGQRVAVANFTPLELLIAYYGAAKCGISVVPIPFSDEQRQRGALETSEAVLFLDSFVNEQTQVESDVVAEEAMVIFTSGTTSTKLKGVRLANQGINDICQFMNHEMQVDEQIIELVFASIDHAFGFGRCHSVLMAGGTVVLPTYLSSPLSIVSLVKQHHCNALSTAPSLLAALLQVASDELLVINQQLKWLQTGAMRFDGFFRSQLCGMLPNTRIFLHYGLSEAMRVTFFELNKHLDKAMTEGPASACSEIKIINEQGQALPSFESGKIAIKGSNLCLGYLDNALWEQQLSDGWFITSDIGYLDEQGFLVFAGRSDDVINYNGVLVHPDEIESKLVELISDNAFSVFGMKDPKKMKDSIIVLCIEGETSITIKEVNQFLGKTDTNFRPSQIIKVAELPRTRSGKVSRALLKKSISE
ncbi:class I adenylate-forming enzyme family protein [Pseudoalteromonas sp. NZS100]|uniref:class I adenylate-forming enzyme family protein n=1 Tax=Pseudoalteromonas sp. NZS100 TaxID=2792046 RepID=UPI0018CDD6AF|nr:class I adenylate-forming enzyme family protein [Pseudoalteromonas sp. NZS100]MBH0067362.1 acyl--CoA ligase [Pseudoalteromonas sp. NZS100]